MSTGDALILNANDSPLFGIAKNSEGHVFTGTAADEKGYWSGEWPGRYLLGIALMSARKQLHLLRAA